MRTASGLHLGHVNLEVGDLASAKRFHDRFLPILGFVPIPITDAAWLGYRKGRMALWFTVSRPRRTHLGRPHVPTTGTTDPISNHLGFRVQTKADIVRIEKELRKRGISPIYGLSRVPTAGRTWYVSAAWHDPDRNVFEVYAATKRTARA